MKMDLPYRKMVGRAPIGINTSKNLLVEDIVHCVLHVRCHMGEASLDLGRAEAGTPHLFCSHGDPQYPSMQAQKSRGAQEPAAIEGTCRNPSAATRRNLPVLALSGVGMLRRRDMIHRC